MSDTENEYVRLLRGGFAFESAPFAVHPYDEERANKYLDKLVEDKLSIKHVEEHIEELLSAKNWHNEFADEQKQAVLKFVGPWVQPTPQLIAEKLIEQISACEYEDELEYLRVRALGKKGRITAMMRKLGKMTPEERQTAGPALNGLRDRVADAIHEKDIEIDVRNTIRQLETEREDLTLPPKLQPAGALHPVMQVFEELAAIFADMGFAVAEGPDIEDDFHNFTALNFPEGHPAREMHDTFFMKPDAEGRRKVLRTHTSPVQIRTMMTQKPPIRVIIPGRVYRKDWDATHTPMFHQIEGLVIDKSTHMGHLKSCLTEAFSRFFEVEHATSRFRPHFFPFTEPSAEMDIRCDRSGKEIKVGEGDDWLEILGCGMVHPNVLKNCGLDPEEYQGFAFGLGVDRLAMLKYGMPDLRPYFEADVDWIKHYGFKPWLLPSVTGGLS